MSGLHMAGGGQGRGRGRVQGGWGGVNRGARGGAWGRGGSEIGEDDLRHRINSVPPKDLR